MRPPRLALSRGAPALVVIASMVACGSKHDPPRAQLPMLEYRSGTILDTPVVISVTFANDSYANILDPFGQTVAASPWWDTVRDGMCARDAGPCVGDGPAGTAIQLAQSAPATFTDTDVSQKGKGSTLQPWLAGLIQDGTLPAPTAGATSNSVYVLYFPGSSATVTFDGLTSCVEGGFSGYHNTLPLANQQVPYVVSMECTPQAPPHDSTVQPLPIDQSTTVTSSHEIVETASDPDGTSGFGLDLSNVENWAWIDVLGGDEAADLCVDQFGLNEDIASSGAYTVQRIWSNRAAAAGHDPCVPAPAGVAYFNAAPRKSFFVADVGKSVTFEVDAFADGPMPEWTLVASDWTLGPAANGYLDVAIAGGNRMLAGDPIQVKNGSTVTVTATLVTDPSSLPTAEADGALISYSGNGASLVAHFWPFAVMSRAYAASAGVVPASRVPKHRPVRRIVR